MAGIAVLVGSAPAGAPQAAPIAACTPTPSNYKQLAVRVVPPVFKVVRQRARNRTGLVEVGAIGDGDSEAMPISIRRAKLLPGGSAEDDYDVMDGNKRIGRLYHRAGADLAWRWIIFIQLCQSASERKGEH
jgi:hypothetical protein